MSEMTPAQMGEVVERATAEIRRLRDETKRLRALLTLADKMCKEACEICNQGDPCKPYPGTREPIPQQAAPTWAFDNLSAALDAYYDARHVMAEEGVA